MTRKQLKQMCMATVNGIERPCSNKLEGLVILQKKLLCSSAELQLKVVDSLIFLHRKRHEAMNINNISICYHRSPVLTKAHCI